MRSLMSALLVVVVVTAAAAQVPDQWLSDTRLSVHTLVLAGFRNNNNNMERLSTLSRRRTARESAGGPQQGSRAGLSEHLIDA
jgi:hypothetical protein